MKLNLANLSIEHADELQDEFAQQELRQRQRAAVSREKRRAHHLAKKNEAPTLGSLIAPGVPADPRLVMHTSSWDYIIGSQL
jgi:hypothetical protein